MPLILSGNVASATASTGYTVDNSCRFNSGDSAYMSITPSGGSLVKATISCWVKRGKITGQQNIIGWNGSGSEQGNLLFQDGTNDLLFQSYNGGGWDFLLKPNRIFRDPSAWMHIVCSLDTTQATDTNRVKIYINGTQETSFSTETYPAQDTELCINSKYSSVCDVGQYNSDWYFDGYMAEVCFIDGTQYAASDFGEFDSDSPTIWKPKDPSGLTFGTNGFYLDFEDSSNLGNDANGGTDLTETNLAATDQATDTPTNNFATLNPLYAPTSNPPTYSEGNLVSITSSTSGEYGWGGATTIGVTSGKWYCEAKATVDGTYSRSAIGVHYDPAEGARDNSYSVNEDYAWGYHSETGVLENDNATVWDGNAYVTDDIIGVYLDLDNHKLYIAKNGVLENSGTGADLTTGKTYHFYQEDVTGTTSTSKFEFNFGAGTSWAVSSGNADANGYGNFEYDPSDGGSSSFDSAAKDFYALCTKNLAEYG